MQISIESGTNWPTACVRRSCEHARNVRTKSFEKAGSENRAKTRENPCEKNLEKASHAKIVRKRAKRVKIRAKKKTFKSRSCENRAKMGETCENPCQKTIVRTVRTFHPNSTRRRNFTKQIPNLTPKICIFKFLTENRTGLRKNLNILFLTENHPSLP